MANAAFDETQALRVSYTRNQKTGLRELTRSFPTSIDNDEATAQDFLAGRVYIDNPRAGKKTYPGRWRVVTVGWDNRVQQLVEVLRFGWASTILTGGAPNAECRLATGSDQRSDARTLTFAWHSIAETSIKDCMDDLSAVRAAGGFNNPTVQGVRHAGNWAIDTITPQQSEDGSYTITVSVNKAFVITAITDLAALEGIQGYVRDINNPFGLEGGYATTAPKAGKKPTEGISLTYKALSKSSRAVLRSLGDDAFLSLLSTADKAKYKTVKAKVDDDVGNTLQLIVVYQYIPLRTTTPESQARYVDLKRSNQSGKLVLTRSWDRIDPAYAKDLLTNNVANPNVTALEVTGPQADGKVYPGVWTAKSTEAPMSGNDGVRIVQELTLSGDADIDVYVGDDPDHGSYTKYLFDASEVAVNAFLAAATFPATNRPAAWSALNPAWNTSEVGITKSVKITNNPDASLNLVAYYSSAKNLKHIELFTTPLTVVPSLYQSEERAWGWNIEVADLKTYSDHYKAIVFTPPDPDPNVNIKREFKITRRDAHTFDFEGVIETLSPIETPEYVAEASDVRKVLRKVGEHLTDAELTVNGVNVYEPPVEAVKGDVVKVERSLEPTGGVKVMRDTITPAVLDTGVVSSHADAAGKEVTRRVAQAKASEVPPLSEMVIDNAVAPILDQEIQRDPETGRRMVVQKGRKELNQTSTSTKSSLIEEETISRSSASPTPLAADAASVNVETEATNDTTPGGNYKGEVRSTRKLPLDSGAVVVEQDALLKKTKQILLNQTIIPAAAANEKVEAKPNGLGGWDIEKIKTALQSGVSLRTWESISETIEDAKQWNEKTKRYYNGEYTKTSDAWIVTSVRYRTKNTTTTRTFSLSMPNAPSATQSSYRAGASAGYTNNKCAVVPIGEGVWCVERIIEEFSDWSQNRTEYLHIGTLTT